MSRIINTLDDVITFANITYEGDSVPPTAGSEDYIVWTGLANLGINLWASEEGVLWNELFVKLADAPDGTKTVTAGTYSYNCPTLFQFSASGYVWLGSGQNKTPYKVIKQQDLTLYENNGGNWCYFLQDTTPTLEFNPNITLHTGDTISYNYYKAATKLTTGTDVVEMSDPGFLVHYVLSELKKEEGDTSALSIATQKLEAMKTKNIMPAYYQEINLVNNIKAGFGV